MILVLCPLKIELDSLLHFFSQKGYVFQIKNQGSLTTYFCDKLNILCAQGGHGKVQFAIQAQFLVDSIKNVESILCVGVAGSLSEEVKVFDVVIATKTIEHDYNLKFIKKDLPVFEGDPTIIHQFKKLVGQNKLHFGMIASGDEDIITKERALELKSQTGAIAVAWEGAGGARVGQFNKLAYLEVRGISDSSSSSAKIDFKENLKSAIHNVAEYLEMFLLNKELQ